ncbi:MAG: KH domain-containing protein [Nanoarchaeota archaeon]|nr:KH domain-containing protein [Nanoarchaeota archaeon]
MFDEVTLSRKKIGELKQQKRFFKDMNDLGVDVSIRGNVVSFSSDRAVDMLSIRDMLLAFGRGFVYDTARMLLDDQYELRIIKLSDYSKSENRQFQIKARIIGRRGSIKRQIGKLTSCFIVVYGKTVSVIGPYEGVEIAVEAIDLLSKGAKYTTVFKFISDNLRSIAGE